MTKFEQDFCFLSAYGVEPPAAASAAELDEFLRNQSREKSAATAAILLEREDIRAAIEAERKAFKAELEACTEDARELQAEARELQAEMDCMIAAARELSHLKMTADIEADSVQKRRNGLGMGKHPPGA